ncbi:MAG: NDP-hexose 4-ketoreductase, partial [Pirellulales bacterium]
TEEIEKVFRPEFINRVNDIIVFRHLNDEDMKQVVDLELAKVRGRLKEKGLTIELTDEAKEFLVKKGSNTDYGARPLRRAIETFVEDPLAEELLKGEFAGKDLVKIEVKKVGDKKQLVFEGLSVKEQPEPEPVGAGAAADGGEQAGEGEA